MRTKIDRWGNSLGVRLPKALAEEAGLSEGSTVEMNVEDGGIVVLRAKPKYTLDELLAQIGDSQPHPMTELDNAPEVGLERFWEYE